MTDALKAKAIRIARKTSFDSGRHSHHKLIYE
jgi:hypothetical protein